MFLMVFNVFKFYHKSYQVNTYSKQGGLNKNFLASSRKKITPKQRYKSSFSCYLLPNVD